MKFQIWRFGAKILRFFRRRAAFDRPRRFRYEVNDVAIRPWRVNASVIYGATRPSAHGLRRYIHDLDAGLPGRGAGYGVMRSPWQSEAGDHSNYGADIAVLRQ
jgi:hypothetical protein